MLGVLLNTFEYTDCSIFLRDLQEMTELHDPLTAIETPHKLDKEFPFYKAAADGQPRQKLFDDSVKKVIIFYCVSYFIFLSFTWLILAEFLFFLR